MDEAIHIVREWSFSLRGGSDAQGIAHTGFPYAGPLRNVGAAPDQPFLILGREPPGHPELRLRVPLTEHGLWSPVDEGFSAVPLAGASPLQDMERVARAAPSARVYGRAVALGLFLAAFKDGLLNPLPV